MKGVAYGNSSVVFKLGFLERSGRPSCPDRGFLPRVLKLREPRVLVAYWRSLLAISLLLPFVEPWHRPQNVRAIVVWSDSVGVPLPQPSTPASAHSHLPSLQTIAPILGVVILAGITFRLAVFVLGLIKLRRLRQAS